MEINFLCCGGHFYVIRGLSSVVSGLLAQWHLTSKSQQVAVLRCELSSQSNGGGLRGPNGDFWVTKPLFDQKTIKMSSESLFCFEIDFLSFFR